MPSGAEYLWRWFVEIINGVTASFGPPSIAWSDLVAWCTFTGELLDPWEARLLIKLSVIRANVLTEETRRAARDNPDTHRADRDIPRRRRPR